MFRIICLDPFLSDRLFRSWDPLGIGRGPEDEWRGHRPHEGAASLLVHSRF